MFQHITTTQVIVNVNFSSVDDGMVNKEIRHIYAQINDLCFL